MSSQGSSEEAHGRYLMALSLTALGIVVGDIGTRPIYALREPFRSASGIDPTQANVLGVLSLIRAASRPFRHLPAGLVP